MDGLTAPLLVTAGVLLGWLSYFWAAPRVDRWRARRRRFPWVQYGFQYDSRRERWREYDRTLSTKEDTA